MALKVKPKKPVQAVAFAAPPPPVVHSERVFECQVMVSALFMIKATSHEEVVEKLKKMTADEIVEQADSVAIGGNWSMVDPIKEEFFEIVVDEDFADTHESLDEDGFEPLPEDEHGA